MRRGTMLLANSCNIGSSKLGTQFATLRRSANTPAIDWWTKISLDSFLPLISLGISLLLPLESEGDYFFVEPPTSEWGNMKRTKRK